MVSNSGCKQNLLWSQKSTSGRVRTHVLESVAAVWACSAFLERLKNHRWLLSNCWPDKTLFIIASNSACLYNIINIVSAFLVFSNDKHKMFKKEDLVFWCCFTSCSEWPNPSFWRLEFIESIESFFVNPIWEMGSTHKHINLQPIF